ncbi:hypothetical protein BX666DRAFT_1988625 [Dichotomocladium elegans]|nr:hypothetical protein BX666DRAFT_1988625 [Dichotomocladium elegans]
MEAIPESALHADNQQLQELFDALFQELHDLTNAATHWPIIAIHPKQPFHHTTVRRDPCKGHPWYLQRLSRLTDVSYDELRSVLFLNHSMNEPKYIELMQDARELLRLPCSSAKDGDAGVYQLAYKATLADGREFIELVVTREETRDNGERRFMVVSKPVILTSDAVRPGFVRGKYEAWEVVTESVNGAVSWECIQRSDPGGWVPKWLADRIIVKGFREDVDGVISYLKRH